ncbi:hypothetical protein [Burkholderia sp. BC1]|uniref:hypothetical protein n=1 Tax=Burkholderia sp. BC1 TaxID=1095370 RepID=UPI0040441F53
MPVEAVLGVIEVKSTLDDRTFAAATGKLAQFDSLLEHGTTDEGYRPFRHVFAYQLDRGCDFDGWHHPSVALTRYALARCQPDGVFVLDDHISVLVKGHGYADVFGLHRGQIPDEVDRTTLDNEEVRRFLEYEDSYCNDYFTTAVVDGLVLLVFLTFVIQRASHY